MKLWSEIHQIAYMHIMSIPEYSALESENPKRFANIWNVVTYSACNAHDAGYSFIDSIKASRNLLLAVVSEG